MTKEKTKLVGFFLFILEKINTLIQQAVDALVTFWQKWNTKMFLCSDWQGELSKTKNQNIPTH